MSTAYSADFGHELCRILKLGTGVRRIVLDIQVDSAIVVYVERHERYLDTTQARDLIEEIGLLVHQTKGEEPVIVEVNK